MGASRSVRALLLLVLLLSVVASGRVGAQPHRPAPAGLCERFGDGEVAGRLTDPGLDELSGLVASRRHPGVLWAHNDSGGAAELFALSPDGALLGTYAVPQADAQDWEDIAIGPGPGSPEPLLYVGDIGDNAGRREHVTVYRLAEPRTAPDGGRHDTAAPDVIRLIYPGGPEDAEALVVDPRSGDLYILTKSYEEGSRILRADRRRLIDGASVTMEDLGRFSTGSWDVTHFLTEPGLPSSAVTAADVSPDGRILLVRTYQRVLAYSRPPGSRLEAALRGSPCEAPQEDELQGEALAFTTEGDAYVTIGEGPFAPVHRFEVGPAAGAPGDATASSPTLSPRRAAGVGG